MSPMKFCALLEKKSRALVRMTDRQTDRGSHWSITVFDETEMARLHNRAEFPAWLKDLQGQMEIAPTTGARHFQGYLHTSQQRFSTIKKFLPTAHIEKARDINALKLYVNKDDTAVEGTRIERVGTYMNMHTTLNKMFRTLIVDNDYVAWSQKDVETIKLYKDKKDYIIDCYHKALLLCLETDEESIAQYTSNAVKQSFIASFPYYEKKYLLTRQEEEALAEREEVLDRWAQEQNALQGLGGP